MKLKVLECEKCGSNDISLINGLWVCSHCGSKYFFDENGSITEKILKGQIILEEAYYALKYKKKNCFKLSKKAVEFLPTNIEAWICYLNAILLWYEEKTPKRRNEAFDMFITGINHAVSFIDHQNSHINELVSAWTSFMRHYEIDIKIHGDCLDHYVEHLHSCSSIYDIIHTKCLNSDSTAYHTLSENAGMSYSFFSAKYNSVKDDPVLQKAYPELIDKKEQILSDLKIINNSASAKHRYN